MEDSGALSPDEESADLGLAAERTDIAWSRSGLALITCAAAVLRRVPSMPRPAGIGILLAVGAMLGGASVLSRRRLASHARDPAIALTRLRLRSFAAMTSFVGALCLIVMLLTVG